MEIKLVWSNKAISKLELILDYLDSNWPESVRKKFIQSLDKKL